MAIPVKFLVSKRQDDRRKLKREYYADEARSPKQIRADLVGAFDEIRNLNQWVKFQGLLMALGAAVIAWGATHLLDCWKAAHELTGMMAMLARLK